MIASAEVKNTIVANYGVINYSQQSRQCLRCTSLYLSKKRANVELQLRDTCAQPWIVRLRLLQTISKSYYHSWYCRSASGAYGFVLVHAVAATDLIDWSPDFSIIVLVWGPFESVQGLLLTAYTFLRLTKQCTYSEDSNQWLFASIPDSILG